MSKNESVKAQLDFIKGIIDGDGSYINTDKAKCVVLYSGSLIMLEGLKSKFSSTYLYISAIGLFSVLKVSILMAIGLLSPMPYAT